MKRAAWAIALVIISSGACLAADDSEMAKFDRDGNKQISEQELKVWTLHQLDATYAKYDANYNGKFEPAELQKIQNSGKEILDSDEAAFTLAAYHRNTRILGREHTYKEAEQYSIPSKMEKCDDEKGLYIRRDKADVSIYTNAVDKSAAEGASISYTYDNLTDTDTATLNAVATYVVLRDPCLKAPKDVTPDDLIPSGFALAPYVALDGEIGAETSKNSARAGVDLQLELFSGGIFNAQYLTFSSYVQTDFDLEAEIYGASATWEPFKPKILLGGSYRRLSDVVDFFWQLQLQADALTVETAGNTALEEGTEYAWLGGLVKANMFLLPEALENRLYAVGEFKQFWDATSDIDVTHYSAEVGFNLDEEGSTSLSVEYSYGKEKETLEKNDKLVVNLNYKL
jgi:hypothetical protein